MEPSIVTDISSHFSELADLIEKEVDLDHLLISLGRYVAELIRAQRATVWLVDAASEELISHLADEPGLDELRLPIGRGVVGLCAGQGKTINIRDVNADSRWASDIDQSTGYTTLSMLCVPIQDSDGAVRGVVQALNADHGHFSAEDETELRRFADELATAVRYTSLRPGPARRGVQIRGRFNHIVGSSPRMVQVYQAILQAAAVDATVLLHGETGTGKGLFARAIHVNGSRHKKPFVYVDCTTLPATLIESELFGRERGAYTGADSSAPGKVELADGGTLFIDELGELALPLQGKLLRFIQDRQFERVGGRETKVSDARIIVATNRDLAELVAQGRFRADLYYRIRVLDIELPPLRERGSEEIHLLSEHFLSAYSEKMKRGALQLSRSAQAALIAHHWPGNVRELEHTIERAVIVSQSSVIELNDLGLARTESPHTISRSTNALPIPVDTPLDAAMSSYARFVLEHHQGNQSATARSLNISRNRLARLLSR